jgi:hypothetical protein
VVVDLVTGVGAGSGDGDPAVTGNKLA